MGVLHGANAIKILIIVSLNFVVVKRATNPQNGVRGRVGIGSIWLYNLGILFANDYFQGYRFGALASSLESLVSTRSFSFQFMLRLIRCHAGQIYRTFA
jgi:hypothetical protein